MKISYLFFLLLPFVTFGQDVKYRLLDSDLNVINVKNSHKLSSKESFNCNGLVEFFTTLFEMSKKGQSISRYKGLGEMNPDQLWETTLDRTNRKLLQVKLEDQINAERQLIMLMGDDVTDRKNFIQDNSVKVANLDI